MSYLITEEGRKRDLKDFMQMYGISEELFPYEWLCSTDFFQAPASRGFHLAHEGGLYEHSRNVTLTLISLTQKQVVTPWERVESPFIVGFLHDVTKIGLYKGTTEGYIKNPNYSSFGGHGYDSVCKIENHMTLTEEERDCIRYHMGAYETDAWDEYDKAIRKHPNVLWTHTADMYASKLMED